MSISVYLQLYLHSCTAQIDDR